MKFNRYIIHILVLGAWTILLSHCSGGGCGPEAGETAGSPGLQSPASIPPSGVMRGAAGADQSVAFRFFNPGEDVPSHAPRLTLELPGIAYPDLSVRQPTIHAFTEEGVVEVGPGDARGDCPSPSRSFYKVPLLLSSPWRSGRPLTVQIENYRLPYRSSVSVGATLRKTDSPKGTGFAMTTEAGPVLPTEPAWVFVDSPAAVAAGQSVFLRATAVDPYGNPSPDRYGDEVSAGFAADPLILEINGQRPDLPPVRLDGRGAASVEIRDLPPGVYRFSLIHGEREVGRSNPCRITEGSREYQRFWGDLHSHTGYSDGYTTAGPAQAFGYARDVSHLDFAAVTDHGEAVWGCPMSDDEWKDTRTQVESFHQPGSFVTFLGFEWTGSFPWDKNWPSHEGHANVVYPDRGERCRADTLECDTLRELIEMSRPHRPIIIRHHTCVDWAPVDFGDADQESMPVVEVASSHGSCECPDCPGGMPDRIADPKHYIQTALLSGLHYGLVGGSDNHHARPGARNFPGMKPMILNAGGLTCVLATELSREGILRAIRERRCYATTSARIYLDFNAGGHPMGSILPKGTNAAGALEVHGTSPLKEIILFRGDPGKKAFSVLRRWTPKGSDAKETWNDSLPPDRALYYLRVEQKDGEMAWSSPIWIE